MKESLNIDIACPKTEESFRKPFLLMKAYILMNMLYNVGSKYLQKVLPQEERFSAIEICFCRSLVGIGIL